MMTDYVQITIIERIIQDYCPGCAIFVALVLAKHLHNAQKGGEKTMEITTLLEYSERYIDVVEEALCFGWIDSTLKKLPDGRLAQRLSPRRKNSHWTKLNMVRCMNLEDRGLMTPAGRRALENAYGLEKDCN